MQTQFTIESNGQGLYEFTDSVRNFVAKSGAESGLLTLFVRHTSCSILVQENADPSVLHDLVAYFDRLVPDANNSQMSWLTHTAEGPDDMPAHIKSAILPTSISIPILNGDIALGMWQGIFLFEHRQAHMVRKVVGHISA
ncbi:secondary thiamine-phosphate synthase enzyme YjbQ [Hirschia litorea]|uniref:Secondary thiamine-phosphate synthase enzyme YjbQ n=1 Tax=Hirschia litorea TaxID=1199156 RepID=A0ABW2IKJ1_9PROT